MSGRFPFGTRAQLAVTVTTALVAVSLALPWAASGRRTRTGWELATTAARLDVTESTIARVALAAFFFIPAGAIGVFVARLLGSRLLMASTATTTIAASAVGALIVLRSPLASRWGVWVNLVACAVDMVCVLSLWRTDAERQHDR